MLKMDGLNKIQKDFEKLNRLIKGLESQPINLNFDPWCPQSIELAIQEYSEKITSISNRESNNPLIVDVIEQLKDKGRSLIIQHAAEMRLKGNK